MAAAVGAEAAARALGGGGFARAVEENLMAEEPFRAVTFSQAIMERERGRVEARRIAKVKEHLRRWEGCLCLTFIFSVATVLVYKYYLYESNRLSQ